MSLPDIDSWLFRGGIIILVVLLVAPRRRLRHLSLSCADLLVVLLVAPMLSLSCADLWIGELGVKHAVFEGPTLGDTRASAALSEIDLMVSQW